MCKKIISFILCVVVTFLFPFSVPVLAEANAQPQTITQETIEPFANEPIDSNSQIIVENEVVPERQAIYHSPDTPKPKVRKVESLVTEDGIDLCIPIEFEEDDTDFGLASQQDRATTFTDSNKKITLNSFNSSEHNFVDIALKEHLTIDSDLGNYYFCLQGGCSNGEYYYFSFVVKNQSKQQVDSRILTCRRNSDGSFTKVALIYYLGDFLFHVNDMTYNSDTGEIAIVCCEKDHYSEVYTVAAEQLYNTWGQTFYYNTVGCCVANIDYNATHNQYVVGISGKLNYFAILDNDLNVIKTVGYTSKLSVDDGWNRQGICTDEQYIYSISYHKTGQTIDGGKMQNIIRLFDWKGNYVKTLQIIIIDAGSTNYELENIMFANGEFFFSFFCAKKQNDETIMWYKYILLSNYTFHIQYCPDENVENYIGEYNNGNSQSVMIRGLSTPLNKFKVSKTGKKFCGWYAYRVEVDKWYYESPDAQTRGWYKEGQQPAGYEKYYYLDEQKVSQTGLEGEHVMMCAIWNGINAFFVRFVNNGGVGDEYGMVILHGESTPLKPNTFTKTNRQFLGWNAYWAEKNKWYYESPNGTTRGWYKEGYQPVGYKKYVYADRQNVAETVHAGGHVYMHALWDEFYIQYDPGVAMIACENIRPQSTGRYISNIQNSINLYTDDDLYFEGNLLGINYSQNLTIVKFSFYRREIDKWLYANENGDRGWYKIYCEPEGYTLYYKYAGSANYIGATALPGEHLVIHAHWTSTQA